MSAAFRVGVLGPGALERLATVVAGAGAVAGAAGDDDDAWIAAGALAGEDADRLRRLAGRGRPLLAIGPAVAGVVGRLAVRLRPGPTGARDLAVVVAGRPTPFTWSLPAGRVVGLGAVRFGVALAPPDDPAAVVLHFAGRDGDLAAGAELGPAAVVDPGGTVVGLVVEPGVELLGQLLRAVVSAAAGRPGRV